MKNPDKLNIVYAKITLVDTKKIQSLTHHEQLKMVFF